MIASLPMYSSRPEQVEDLWRHVAGSLRASGYADVPDALVWPTTALSGHWLGPQLLLSQACGFPLMTELRGKVGLVGTFRYRAEGCAGAHCRSQIVARVGDADTLEGFRGRILAYNGVDSQSGYNSLRVLVAPLAHQGRFFGSSIATGAHRRSVELVRDGLADIASIDAVTWAGLARHEPEVTHGLRVIAMSDAYPGLPLITSARTGEPLLVALRAALSAAMRDPALAASRSDLFIEGFEPIAPAAYQTCLDMRDAARALGCEVL